MFPSAVTVVTANPGGGQANAALLGPDFNQVSVVATIATSPIVVWVANPTTKSMQVYGTGTDTINGVAAGTGVPQLGGSIIPYVADGVGTWVADVAIGFSGGLPTVSSTNGIAATASGTQSTSVLLGSAINRVTTVTTTADSVLLPLSTAGMQLIVTNATSNSMGIFPGVGDAVNALSANAVYALAAGKSAIFSCAVAGTWHAILSA